MGKIFLSDNMEKFMQESQAMSSSQEEMLQHLRTGITYVAPEIHLGLLESHVFFPESELTTKGALSLLTFYDAGHHSKDSLYEKEYETGNQGKITVFFYPVTGYTWTEDDKELLTFISNQIYIAMRQVILVTRLRNSVTTDLASQIPNLSGFSIYAGQIFKQQQQELYDGFFFNIHNFRYVNTIFPYFEGTQVLKKYARQVYSYVNDFGIVARLNGDNFIALVEKKHVDLFLKQISCVRISHQYENLSKDFTFSATVGATHLENTSSPTDIMFQANTAYSIARQSGLIDPVNAVYFSHGLSETLNHEKEIILNFNYALRNNEFEVYYQPKVISDTREICGAEALVRWKRNGEIVPPSEFIPILEKEGSICTLDFYVLEHVCRLLARWKKEGRPLTKISINFSRRHLLNKHFVRQFLRILDSYDVPHEYIEAEFTESDNFKDYETMSDMLKQLKEHNISTSIDDFGTGYSSLTMLKNTNLDVIKIDKSFIPTEEKINKEEEGKDVIMLNNIIQIAQDFGMEIIAEGVENEEQLSYLKSLNCNIVQGFLFDRPLQEDEFEKKLEMSRPYLKK